MTCIIGLVEGSDIWLGADGQTTTDDGCIRTATVSKIFRNRDYTFSYCGSIRTAQLVAPELFEPPEDIIYLPNKLYEHFSEYGCVLYSPNEVRTQTTNFLVVYKGKLYEILSDFQIGEVLHFSALGSGSSYAFGALDILVRLKLPPKEKVRLALETACKFDSTSSPPFTIERVVAKGG